MQLFFLSGFRNVRTVLRQNDLFWVDASVLCGLDSTG